MTYTVEKLREGRDDLADSQLAAVMENWRSDINYCYCTSHVKINRLGKKTNSRLIFFCGFKTRNRRVRIYWTLDILNRAKNKRRITSFAEKLNSVKYTLRHHANTTHNNTFCNQASRAHRPLCGSRNMPLVCVQKEFIINSIAGRSPNKWRIRGASTRRQYETAAPSIESSTIRYVCYNQSVAAERAKWNLWRHCSLILVLRHTRVRRAKSASALMVNAVVCS